MVFMDDARYSVLIIDDQMTSVTALSNLLRPEYHIYAAVNGRDAVIAAETSLPDVILLDIHMHDMDGYEVITALKKSEKTKDIPVIFITGLAGDESEEKGLALGAVDYITKPFSTAIVKLRLQNQIKMLEQLRTIERQAEQLEAALEEAQAANTAKSKFLSSMSHEIRTPMNAITGMGEILLHERLSERQKGYVDDIVVSSKALLGIINDILDFSKIESGKLELNPVDYDFNSMIENIEAMFLYIARKKDLEFKFERLGDLPDVLYGDDIRLRQALTNILSNAVKFTEHGYVHLKISQINDSLIFDIKDTGIGIRKDDLPKLFNAFEQVDKSKNRGVVGTGLGLVISKSFIEMMGGSITLDSDYGHGTVFTITIPVVLGSREHIERKIAEKESHVISAPEASVLVVDDNEFNLKVACGLLGLVDIEAEMAVSGVQAIGMVKQKDYDIVFMDHMMPEMDGLEATAKIREMGGKYEHLPVIALTANAIQGAREMFLANGFNDFISKPIDSYELTRVLENWLPPEKVKVEIHQKDQQTRSSKEDELLLKATVTFVKENKHVLENITALLSSGDIKTAHRIAHTLKSSAGYLKKTELQEAAFSIEQSLQSEPPAYTSEQLDTLERELTKALLEFEPLVKESLSNKPDIVQIDDKKLMELLLKIKPFLEKGDVGAVGFVADLQSVAGMDEMASLIDDYDFEGALELLNTLLYKF